MTLRMFENSSVQTGCPGLVSSRFQRGSSTSVPSAASSRATRIQIELAAPSLGRGRCDGVGLGEAGEAERSCVPGDHRPEIEVPVRDVERHQAVGAQLAEVQLDRLAREQVHRHRVGAERVEHEEVERAVGRLGELQPPVAEDDADVRLRVAQEREVSRVSAMRATASSIS